MCRDEISERSEWHKENERRRCSPLIAAGLYGLRIMNGQEMSAEGTHRYSVGLYPRQRVITLWILEGTFGTHIPLVMCPGVRTPGYQGGSTFGALFQFIPLPWVQGPTATLVERLWLSDSSRFYGESLFATPHSTLSER